MPLAAGPLTPVLFLVVLVQLCAGHMSIWHPAMVRTASVCDILTDTLGL
jgi:hypothetical protein